MGWTVRGSIPGGGGARFSAPVQTGPGAHPASCIMGTGSFPGVKRPGRGADHPPSHSAEVKERVELYLYSTSGSSWPVQGEPLPLPNVIFPEPRTCSLHLYRSRRRSNYMLHNEFTLLCRFGRWSSTRDVADSTTVFDR